MGLVRATRFAIALALAALGGARTLYAAPGVEIMKEADVRPGMKGYGLSVFEGTEIKRFDVEVLGILKNVMPKQSIILIRCSGAGLEKTGTVGGMSGSPIYIEGKLIGALGYGWMFAKDPIAGVTPIESMLEEARRPLHGPIASVKFGDAELTPVSTPLVMAGFHPLVVEKLRPLLAPYGMVPMQGMGGGPGSAPAGTKAELVPGAAIGVTLIQGDLSATGIGTVSYRDGNQVLAFGHPMFGLGEQYLPVTTAYVHHTLASTMRSVKMATPLDVVGSLTGDRQSCIVGELGRTAPMLPVTVRIARRDKSYKQTYKMEVLKHKLFGPLLTGAVASNAMLAAEGDLNDVSYSVGLVVRMKGYEPLKLKGHFFSPFGFFDPRPRFFSSVFTAVGMLMNNPFGTIEVESVEYDIEVAYKKDLVQVESLYLAEWDLHEGQTVDLNVVLRPIGKPPFTRKISVTLPDGLGGRDAMIEVAAGGESQPDHAPPQSLDDLVRVLRDSYDSRSLITAIGKNAWGVKMRGRKLSELPRTYLEILNPAQVVGGSQVYNDVEITRTPIGTIATGRAQLRIRVKERKD